MESGTREIGVTMELLLNSGYGVDKLEERLGIQVMHQCFGLWSEKLFTIAGKLLL